MTDVTNVLKPENLNPENAHEVVSDFVQQLRDDPSLGFGVVPPGFGTLPPKDAADKLNGLLQDLPVLPATADRPRSPSGKDGGGSGGTSGGVGGGKASPRGGRTGRGGKDRTISSGSAGVRPVATRLASFISDVPKLGLREALLRAGVDVEGLPPDKIALAIADVLADESTLLIDTELRDALSNVMVEICRDAATFEAAEQALIDSAYGLQDVIERFFKCYIIERFKTFFSEHESLKYGFEAADKVLNQASSYVSSKLQAERAAGKDLTQVEWGGKEGASIIDAILENTIAVFIGE